MLLTIANISSKLSSHDVNRVVAAIQRQVTEHFHAEWGKSATLRTVALAMSRHAAPIDGRHDAIIYLGDSSQDPTTGVDNALGYHASNHAKSPYGFIYLDICAKYGELWSTTLSHEVLELIEDPTAAKIVSGPAPNNPDAFVYYDLEVCDPTQGDTYEIDGVTVSNFVGRAYFGLRGGSGKTNFLDLELAPFGVRPGGYFQYAAADGRRHQVDGPDAERRKAAKKAIEHVRRTTQRERRMLGT